ncbi:MAG: helix-turn-helix domain-containing protein [Chloroflexota bacterium]
MKSADLDKMLDQVVAEAALQTGTAPGQIARHYPDVSISTAYIRVVKDFSKHLPWSSEQDAVIRQWFGRVRPAELARRVNAILHQEMNTTRFHRSEASISQRASVLGVSAYSGDHSEIRLVQAARTLNIAEDTLRRAIQRGELLASRKGKQCYICRQALSNWFVAFRERQLAQSEMLNALEGEDLISKKEAMALTGLRETHLTRYLKTGVIKAWKVPNLTPNGGRGEWLVQRQSADALAAARQAKRVRDLWTDAYWEIQQATNIQVRQLSQQPKFGQPDPLKTPKSRYLPGCYTVAQVASHLQIKTQTLYDLIMAGQVQACTIKRGGRLRYAIAPNEARRYVMNVQGYCSF